LRKDRLANVHPSLSAVDVGGSACPQTPFWARKNSNGKISKTRLTAGGSGRWREFKTHVPDSSVKNYGYFAGNQWRKAANNEVFEVHEPYSGKLFARVAAGTRADGRAAVDAAAKAFPEWSETTPATKARLFLKASEIVKRRRGKIADVLARETGSTISFATFQQDLVAATLEQVAGWVYLPKGEVLETNAPGSHSIGVRRPLGVVASFTPWNGANVLSWRAVISPVAAGNTVVVKPSEFAPVSAGIMLAEVAEEAGFPAGVINVVTHAPGAAGAIADEFFDSPRSPCHQSDRWSQDRAHVGGTGRQAVEADRDGARWLQSDDYSRRRRYGLRCPHRDVRVIFSSGSDLSQYAPNHRSAKDLRRIPWQVCGSNRQSADGRSLEPKDHHRSHHHV
jgi:hypothetical protein